MFDYFHGKQSDEFSFFRIPKLLFTDKKFRSLSNESKILYGLLLDRMSLSRKNNWYDELNRTYIIYTIEEITEDLNCSRPTAIAALKELDTENGIGLVEKKRRGQGMASILYVRDFTSCIDEDREERKSTSEDKKVNFKKSKNLTSKNKKSELQEVTEFDSNKIYNNKTDKNNTVIPSICPDYAEYDGQTDRSESLCAAFTPDTSAEEDRYSRYTEMIKDNINYKLLEMKNRKAEERLESGEIDTSEFEAAFIDLRLIRKIIQYMVEICAGNSSERIRIGESEKPKELVRKKFTTCVDNETMLQVYWTLKRNEGYIRNPQHYAVSMLYNNS